MKNFGYDIIGDEKLKLTICPKSYGYTGNELYIELKKHGITCEMCDPDYVVMMFSPDDAFSLKKVESALASIPKKLQKSDTPPAFFFGEQALSIRTAYFADRKEINVENAEGEILAVSTITCPPAVSISVAGERITKEAIDLFRYYGIKKCFVIK